MGQPLNIVKALILVAMLSALAFIISGFFPNAWGFELKDVATYFGTTDKDITVSWDHNSPLPDRYEVRLYHVERESEGPAGIGGGPGNALTFKLPRSGHFVAWIRACMEDPAAVEGCGVAPCCGEWAISTDPAVAIVDGVARGWWIYGHVAPPGAVVVNEGP